MVTGFLLGIPVTYIMTSGGKWQPVTGSWPSPEMYGRYDVNSECIVDSVYDIRVQTNIAIGC